MKLLGLLASLCLALIGSASQATDADWLPNPLAKPLSDVTIGLSALGVGVNAYTAVYGDAFNAYAAELGVKTVVLDAQADPSKQASDVQTLIARKVDVIIIWPANARAIVPTLHRARQAGIPVVITNSKVDPSGKDYYTAYTGPDDYGQAAASAKSIVEGLAGKGSVVIVNGPPGYDAAEQRRRAFEDIFSQAPGIRILDVQPGDWSQESGQSLMENYITRFGNDIDAVVSAAGEMGLGALTAAKAGIAENRLAKLPLFSDPTFYSRVYDAMKSGEYYSSVVQSPIIDARIALKTAILIAEGQSVPKEIFMDAPLVTQGNLDKIGMPDF